MHRGRFGGNARKRKAKLTDATFHKMIGVAPPAEAPIGILPVAEPSTDDSIGDSPSPPPRVMFNLVRPARRAARTRPFDSQEYQFGYADCRHCRNEQAYYLHQEDLAEGYTFRCRVCRMEMTITREA